MNIKFIDHSEEVKAAFASLALSSLEEVSGELESQVKQNTAVKTGETKGSWTHRVTAQGDVTEGVVGSSRQNAIWEEFGTGDYAINGNGRKGGWFYVDEEGNGHFTHGKKARRPFHRAYTSLKPKLIKHIQDVFKGGIR